MFTRAVMMLVAAAGGLAAQSSMRVHSPAGLAGTKAPLLVVLHGCAQSTDDLARATGLNEAADRNGFVVLYPEQLAAANALRCWNWFEPANQKRGGEAAAIVAMIDSVARSGRIDLTRVYIAGLSAGGAMAVNIATLFPERFAGAMSHSGIPVGAATGAAAAFGVMRGGPPATTVDSVRARIGKDRSALPLLVMQGDADVIVNPLNAPALSLQWLRAGGVVKEVIVPGLGHGWAPGATQAMLDFFRLVR